MGIRVLSVLRDSLSARRDACHSPIMSSGCLTRSRALSTPKIPSSHRVSVAGASAHRPRGGACRARVVHHRSGDVGFRRGVQRDHDRKFPDTQRFRFCRDVRWCGVCHHRSSVVRQDGSWRIGCWGFAPASYQGGRGLIHQPYGRSVPAPLRRVSRTQPAAAGQPSAVPLFVWASSFGNRSLGKPQPGRHRLSAVLSPV
ncbi:Uncharacterised protein [Mycobacterium tuberculosis]|nr:Uncharacterised protein [Mycobacterium tuberculosis]